MKIVALFLAGVILFGGTSCSFTESSSFEKETLECSELANTIIEHIDAWEYVCDAFTRKYTYDDVQVTGVCLYSAGAEGKYYFGVLYTMPGSGRLTTYHTVYYVDESDFYYVYGAKYSEDDRTVANCKLLAVATVSSGSDKSACIKKLVSLGVLSEKEYFEEINLSGTDTIELTGGQNKLFNNMYNAIKELEYYERGNIGPVPLAKIEYYILGNGACEVLLYHGYTIQNYGSYYVGGYLINENGYKGLSYDDEKKLENTSKIITLNWNVEWKEEKKEYMLKKSIVENS